jgi:hypothetical protein
MRSHSYLLKRQASITRQIQSLPDLEMLARQSPAPIASTVPVGFPVPTALTASNVPVAFPVPSAPIVSIAPKQLSLDNL